MKMICFKELFLLNNKAGICYSIWATINIMLRRMIKKEAVRCDDSGRYKLFSPNIDKEESVVCETKNHLSKAALVIAIIFLRFLFRNKISLKLQYALRIPVLLRLLLLFTFGESTLSIMNWIEFQKSNTAMQISQLGEMSEYLHYQLPNKM